jgi:hypothetical protein
MGPNPQRFAWLARRAPFWGGGRLQVTDQRAESVEAITGG